METGSQGRRDMVWQLQGSRGEAAVMVAGGMSSPTFMCGGQKLGGTPGEQVIPDLGQTMQPRVQREYTRKIKLHNFCKNQWGLEQWNKLPVSQENRFKEHTEH